MQFAQEVKSYTCIRCPLGCRLEVSLDDEGQVLEVSGYTCERGKEYAYSEATDPKRMVTSLVYVEGFLEPLSVKTAAPVPKADIACVLEAIKALQLKGPIHAGEVLIENVCNSGVAVIATKNLVEKEEDDDQYIL